MKLRLKFPRGGRHTLLILAGLLVGSGMLRLGLGAGEAIAREGAPEDSAMSNQAGLVCEPPPDIAAVLDALQEREDRLATAEAAFENRMQALRVAEEEIQKDLEDLTRAEIALSETLALADRAAEDDLARLTSVYENMKPKEAAELFATMDPEFAAGFLGRMRPEAAAGIFAGLDPDTAYSISAILAGRNANVPTE